MRKLVQIGIARAAMADQRCDGWASAGLVRLQQFRNVGPNHPGSEPVRRPARLRLAGLRRGLLSGSPGDPAKRWCSPPRSAGPSAAVLAALLFSACGAESSSDGEYGGVVFAPTGEQQAATAACFRERGVSAADIALSPDVSGDDKRRRDIAWECAVENGTAEIDGDTAEEREAATEKAIGLVECMRDLGWTMPDPEPAVGGGLQPPSQIEIPTDGEERAAFTTDFGVCQAEHLGVPLGDG